MVRLSRSGTVWTGKLWRGEAMQVRTGLAMQGLDRVAWQDRHSPERIEKVWSGGEMQVRRGRSGMELSGEAWNRFAGKAGSGLSRRCEGRHGRCS